MSKNYEIECAIVELEKELLEIKKRKTLETIVPNEGTEVNAERVDENMNVEENVASVGSSEENKPSPSPSDKETPDNEDSPMNNEAQEE